MNAKPLLSLLAMMLAACSDGTGETGPGGVSVEDAKALDAAAAKLDQESVASPNTKPETEN